MLDEEDRQIAIDSARAYQIWSDFVKVAREEGINLDHVEDWSDHWIMFVEGASAQMRLVHRRRQSG